MLLTAVLLAGGLALVPRPWGEGPVLDVTPDLAGLGRGGPLPETSPSTPPPEEVATVALPASAPAPPGEDPERARLQATLEALDALTERLGPPAVEVARPCLREQDGACVERALDDFFEGLYAVATERRDRPVRWTWLGDSHTAWVDGPTRFRRLMQAQFGDGGIGLILPGDPGHARDLQDVERIEHDWRVRTAPFHDDPLFGLSGAVFRGGRTQVRSPTPVDRVGVLSWGQGEVEIRHGERLFQGELTRGLVDVELSEPVQDVTFTFRRAEDPIAGLLLERSAPGVIVDNLGVVSLRAEELLKVDDTVWVAQAQALRPDVLVYGFGAKSLQEPAWHRQEPPAEWIRTYEADFGRVLARGRRVPADCLVLGLLTRAEPDPSGKHMVELDSVEPTVEAQARAARAHGCAFFDSRAALQHEGGPDAWYWHEPRLLGFDLIHLTPDGYHRYGTLLYTSLMWSFRDWLTERAVR